MRNNNAHVILIIISPPTSSLLLRYFCKYNQVNRKGQNYEGFFIVETV